MRLRAAALLALVLLTACARDEARSGGGPDTQLASLPAAAREGDAEHVEPPPARVADHPGSAESGGAREPRYLSLLIGIGAYRHAAEWEGQQNLRGPVNDVKRMQHTLRRWGFVADAARQRVLLDEQATRTGIAEAFRWLASRATDTADVVVIYYSGHGSWAPDVDIDAIRRRDEHLITPGDSADEALVPWDARDLHDPRQLVLDDEIGFWLDALGTTNVTLIVDACFSGTITRGAPDPEGEAAPRPRGPRPPPFATLGGDGGLLDGSRGMNHTLLTAAGAWELAYEKTFHPGGVTSGVFTRHLADVLDGAPPTIRFDELLHQVRARMGQNQTPQLEGDRAAILFRVRRDVAIPQRGFALVTARRAGSVVLDVGAVHGVRLGSVFEVFAPGETRFSGPPIGRVRIDSLAETSAVAGVLSSTRRIPLHARATLSRVPAGALTLDRLSVYIAPGARALRDSLRGLEWVAVTNRSDAAMAELRQRNGVVDVLVDGHRIAPLAAEEALGLTRRPNVPHDSIAGYATSTTALCAPLRRAFSIVGMQLARNDRAPAGLRVDLRLLPAGQSDSAPRPTGVDTVRAGARYDLWVWVDAGTSTQPPPPLYLSVGVGGFTSSPTILWPTAAGPPAPLAPEQLGGAIRVRRNLVVSPVLGVERLTAVVSSDPYDLRTLAASLPECAPAAARGPGAAPDEPPRSIAAWTTAERLVEILPAPQRE